MTKQTHIVIVGGGFAGMKLIRKLKNNPQIRITLLSEQEDFRYYPALYRTATGHLKRETSMPIRDMIAGVKNVEFVKATASKIDRAAHTITTDDGTVYSYDYAVIALGMVTNYFGTPGLEQYSYTIKNASGLDKLRAHLHDELVKEHALDKNYIVVGAGPTGIELSAALRSYLTLIAKRHGIRKNKVNIELIEAAPRILPVLEPRAAEIVQKRLVKLGVKVMTGKMVQGETEDSLTVSGRSLPTHTVVWTAGVMNNPFFAANANQFVFNERKKVVVDENLQVDDHTFVIGDNAATPYSGLALTAVHNAAYVGHRLHKLIAGKKFGPYKPLKSITVIPVGPRWAVVQWGKLVFGGWIGSLLRVAADFIGYSDVVGPIRAVGIMRRTFEHEESCPTCLAAMHVPA